MNSLSVLAKSGFCSLTSPVIIYEKKRGLVFYEHKGNPTGEAFYFNLPRGEYLTKNELVKLKEPIPVHLPKLPKPQKNLKFPAKVSISYSKNPNKASVWTALNHIKIDPDMMKRTIPEIMFLAFHEAGHYLYKDEEKCDLFAVREMLKLGFNPSQCFFAVRDALGNFETSVNRKICIYKKLLPNG